MNAPTPACEVSWEDISTAEKAATFREQTFGAYRSCLENFDSERFLAVGAVVDGMPAGLILCRLEDKPLAHILSIYVVPALRRRGFAAELLRRAEERLATAGFQELEISYRSGREITPGLEALLAREGWPPSSVRQIYCRTNGWKMLEAGWIQSMDLPPEYEVIPWSEVTDEDRASILARQEEKPFFLPELNPLVHEVNHEPINSLALRLRGEVVGWLITHRIDGKCIRYTCSYLRPDLQSVGRLVALYGEAMRRQIAVLGEDSTGIWTVPVKIPRMAAFVRRRFAPFLLDFAEFRFARKVLVGGGAISHDSGSPAEGAAST